MGGWVGKHNVQKGTFIEIKQIIYVNSCEKSKQWHSVEICRGNEKMYRAFSLHKYFVDYRVSENSHLQIVSHKFLFSRNFELDIILVKQFFIFMVSPRYEYAEHLFKTLIKSRIHVFRYSSSELSKIDFLPISRFKWF